MLFFLKKVFNARTGQICVLINLLMFAFALWQREGFGRPFHAHYEPLLLLILLLLNLPSILIAGLIFIPLTFGTLGLNTDNENILAQIIIGFIVSSFQWLLIGYWLELLFLRSARPDFKT